MSTDKPTKPLKDIFKDLTDPRLMYLKAGLLLLGGLLCAIALFVQNPGWLTLALLGFTIWSFCRLYYFFFYVIEKYIDSSYKFDSMHSAIYFLIKRELARSRTDSDTTSNTTKLP